VVEAGECSSLKAVAGDRFDIVIVDILLADMMATTSSPPVRSGSGSPIVAVSGLMSLDVDEPCELDRATV